MTRSGSSHQEEKQTLKQQAGKILSQVAGYVGVITMEIGLRFGLLEELAKHPTGISATKLAKQRGMDPFYVQVWCRSAYASDLLELENDQKYILAPHMDKLLLDQDFPGYIGGIPQLMEQPEVFDQFAENMESGQHNWWDQFSPTFIQRVSDTARPFYTRLIPGGLSQVPGLADRLAKDDAYILELACGTGTGLLRLAMTYPQSNLAGVDGDAYSLKLVAEKLQQKGFQDQVQLVQRMLEDLSETEKYDLVVINVSMHECRDLEKVASNVYRALKAGGYFVISDFPFPNSTQECRTVPARLMCGIQFAEAIIDDQLLPTQAFVNLLTKHNFHDVDSFDLSPVHAVTYGQK